MTNKEQLLKKLSEITDLTQEQVEKELENIALRTMAKAYQSKIDYEYKKYLKRENIKENI